MYIAVAPDGKILLDCKRGCSFNDIISAAGLSPGDCFAENPAKPKSWELIREHIYTEMNGGILAKKQIYDTGDGKKQAVWYRLEKGSYIKGLDGKKMPLYHLDRLVNSSGTIVIAEGEKDVETIESLGYTATTSPNGAGSKWRQDFNGFFSGKNVVIITDNDETGEKYGKGCAEGIYKAAAAVKLIRSADIFPEVKPKGDISDIAAELGAEETKKRLISAVENAQLYKPHKTEVVILPQQQPPCDLSDKLRQLHPDKLFSRNDRGNGELFSAVFGSIARYNVTAKEWYIYKEGRWQEDTGGMAVSNYAKELYDSLLAYSLSLPDGEKTSYTEHVNKMGRLNVRENMIKDARSRSFIKNDMLDKNDWLFNCRNGTYDLKTGAFRSHDPNDLLSRMSNVVYDPSAQSPDFERFINDIMCGDKDKIRYLTAALGYSLTGDTSQECMFMLYGSTTRNGKGTLMETISHMMGGEAGYALTAAPETLAKRQNKDSRQASGDIARLNGARFLNVAEPEKNMIFDSALIKTLTGRDTITARHLHQREFQFIPSFKLFINTNYLPHVNDNTVFASERINVITFDRHFSNRERDRSLKNRLRSELNVSGIFNFCLKGLRDYLENGLVPPNCVVSATEEYCRISDRQGLFISECLEECTGACVSAKEAYDTYIQWCTDNNYRPENKSNFMAGLRSKQLLYDHGTVNGRTLHNVIRGYRIAEGYYPDENIPPF